MSPRAPFTLISWHEDFLQGLADLALEETNGNISRAVFIFPHSRPRRYLSLLLRQNQSVRRPLIMPGMHTVSALFSACAGRILARPAWNAGLLDRIGLLLSCVRAEADEDGGMPFLTEARAFFPWGIRLAALFEECFSQHRKPVDFLHAEDQASPFAALLLSRLGGIFSRYAAAMREREWTSPGLDAALTADHLLAARALPEGVLPDPAAHPVYIAGFHALTGTENILFRHLWEATGARVVLHGDAALPSSPDKAHWSCRILADWAGEWRAPLVLRPQRHGREHGAERRIRYYAGFDLHSQLAALREELADCARDMPNGADPAPENCAGPQDMPKSTSPASEEKAAVPDIEEQEEEEAWESLFRLGDPAADHRADTLVALPDSGLLMPVLHHLPRVDVNISMGYPLARSPVFRLVDTLARLQEGRKSSGYYWRDLIDLIRHPYLKMLRPRLTDEPPAGDASANGLRRELHRLEEVLRGHGRKYADPRELVRARCFPPPGEEQPSPEQAELLERLLSVTLTSFENPERPVDLANALEGLCAFLLAHGRHLWKRFPIDAECLHRLRQSLIPELARSALAREHFPPEALFAMLRNLLEAERVPFEAAPLVGLQVMGLLETRLLSFRRVLIVDAGEDALPGSPAGDPLLPEALRPELGLPPLHSREQVAAYTFFRLIAGAGEVAIFWQEGGDAPGIQEQKKKKSRFVEELLWEEEKRLGRLLRARGRDGPLTVLENRAAPVPTQRRGIPATPPIRDLIADLQKKPLSASLLDSYLRCPVRFFHERLLRLAPADEVTEGDDPLAVGNLFHEALQQAYASSVGLPLPGGKALAERLEKNLFSSFFSSPSCTALLRSLPADSAAMLVEAGQKRLADYLLRQPPTTILALETPLSAVFSLNGERWLLTGTADRIDLRLWPDAQGNEAEGLIILDYKTGRLPSASLSLWEDEDLWQRMEAWLPGADQDSIPDADQGGRGASLLAELAERLESVQLPFYLLLHDLAAAQGTLPHARADVPALDAAWVALAHTGEEKPLFPHTFSRTRRRETIRKRIPTLVAFLLRHMYKSPILAPRPGKHCDWCFSAKLCTLPCVAPYSQAR